MKSSRFRSLFKKIFKFPIWLFTRLLDKLFCNLRYFSNSLVLIPELIFLALSFCKNVMGPRRFERRTSPSIQAQLLRPVAGRTRIKPCGLHTWTIHTLTLYVDWFYMLAPNVDWMFLESITKIYSQVAVLIQLYE